MPVLDQKIQVDQLNGDQKVILRKAILSAFKREELDTLLDDGNMGSLERRVERSTFENEVASLIQASQRNGWTDRLIAAVRRERPTNLQIARLESDLTAARSISLASPATEPMFGVLAHAPELNMEEGAVPQ